MQILVNGKALVLKKKDCSVKSLIQQLKLNEEIIIIELNRGIIAKENYSKKKLVNGDKIEIIQFIGGG